MKHLSAKVIAEKIAEGWGYTQLADYAEGTVKELEDFITSPDNFNRHCRREYHARLLKNDKIYKRCGTSMRLRKESEGTAFTPEEGASAGADLPPETEPVAPEEGVVLKKDRVQELDELIARSTAKVVRLEQEHKRIASERHKLREELRPLEGEFERLKKRFLAMQEQVEKTCLRLTESEADFLSINKERAEELSLLESLKGEREALATTDIYVENDKISDDMGVEFALPEGWQDLFVSLRDSETAEDYTIKEIRVAAQVMAVVRQFERYALAVDSDRVASLLARSGISVN